MSVVLVALALAASSAAVPARPPAPKIAAEQKIAAGPRVEVAFVLDTTGSMGGLIDGAKRRIWSIARRIGEGRPRPDLRIALVAYRDIGDAYVTRTYDLTGDMDEVFAISPSSGRKAAATAPSTCPRPCTTPSIGSPGRPAIRCA